MKRFYTLITIAAIVMVAIGCKKSSDSQSPASTPDAIKPMGLEPSIINDTLILEYAEDLDLEGLPSLHKGTGNGYIVPGLPKADSQWYSNCVCWAVGYGMFSTIYGSRETSSSAEGRTFSPAFISNQLTPFEYTYYINVLEFVKSHGVCKTAHMNNNTPPIEQPSNLAKNNAQDYKIFSYQAFHMLNLELIKELLKRNYVLPFAMKSDEGFHNLNNNSCDNLGTTNVTVKRNAGKFIGNHALLICGYDDDLRAFRVLNSWGGNWGDEGYVWIDYDYLKANMIYRKVKGKDEPEIYSCQFKPIPGRSTNFHGKLLSPSTWQSFSFTHVTPNFVGDIRFSTIDLTLSFDNYFYHAQVATTNDIRNFPAGSSYDPFKPQTLTKYTVNGNNVEIGFKGARYVGTISGNSINGIFYQDINVVNTVTNAIQTVVIQTPLILK